MSELMKSLTAMRIVEAMMHRSTTTAKSELETLPGVAVACVLQCWMPVLPGSRRVSMETSRSALDHATWELHFCVSEWRRFADCISVYDRFATWFHHRATNLQASSPNRLVLMHQNLEEVKHLHLSGPGHSLTLLGLSSPWMSYSEGSHQSPSGGTSLATYKQNNCLWTYSCMCAFQTRSMLWFRRSKGEYCRNCFCLQTANSLCK